MPQPSSLPAITTGASDVAFTDPPETVRPILDQAGVMRFERLPDYEGLLAALAQSLAPADAVDWIWVKDLADLIWEMRRLRAAKAAVLAVSWAGAVSFMSSSPLGGGDEPAPETEGHAYYRRLKDMERLDRMLTITGVRRDTVLRELEQRRTRRAAETKA
jgi:hypothetical protein